MGEDETPRWRALGYYLSGLSNLKTHLAEAPDREKMVQVQSRLITKQLEARPEFTKPRSVSGRAQRAAYVAVVQSVRPDLEEELILRMLPVTRQ